MNNVEFKLPKIKSIKKDPYLEEQILAHAMLLGLYDSRFPDEEQCGGFHAFKELVYVENLISTSYVDAKGYFSGDPKAPGYYLLQRLHTLLRRPALKAAHQLQSLAKSRKQ